MDLHGQIMNIPAIVPKANSSNYEIVFKEGHKAARHAAAEIALKADAEIARLRDVLETIAAQGSGVVCSTSKADCMAAVAQAALRAKP